MSPIRFSGTTSRNPETDATVRGNAGACGPNPNRHAASPGGPLPRPALPGTPGAGVGSRVRTWARSGSLAAGCLLPAAAPAAAQTYRDLAAEWGVTVVTGVGSPEKNHIAESTGTGVAVLDYDQDGFPDLYFPNAPVWDDPDAPFRRRSGALYRNEQGRRYAEVTEAAGLSTGVWGQGAVSGDFDADGFPDLYLTALGPNRLFRNNGDGTFTDLSAAAGVDDDGWGLGAVFLDADGDGFADLFVANYIATTEAEIRAGRRTRRWRGAVPVLDGPRGLVPQANRLYRNRGDGRFEDRTAAAGIASLPPR